MRCEEKRFGETCPSLTSLRDENLTEREVSGHTLVLEPNHYIASGFYAVLALKLFLAVECLDLIGANLVISETGRRWVVCDNDDEVVQTFVCK